MMKVIRNTLILLFAIVFIPAFTIGVTLLIPMFFLIALTLSKSREQFKQDFPAFVKELYKFAFLRWFED
jgi:ABC-type microcin C transport system permease subunit YejB